jgi:hypothetical protein
MCNGDTALSTSSGNATVCVIEPEFVRLGVNDRITQVLVAL